MDFEDYVAARYGRLIERAVLMGCPEGEASVYVDRVLLDQRKRIRRADDPDPVVLQALEVAVAGEPERRRPTGPLAAIGLVGVTVIAAVALTYRPAPEPMPSLFGYDGPGAEKLLEERGFDVTLRPSRVCEPAGQVVGSIPGTGELVERGGEVSVWTAVPSVASCEAHYVARSDAWEFIEFALGGPAPPFAGTVDIHYTGGPVSRTLSREAAGRRDRWGQPMELIADVARSSAESYTGMPRLIVTRGVPPDAWCGGMGVQGAAGDLASLRLEIDTRAEDDVDACPLTIDLYRDSERAIHAVVVHPPVG